MEKIVFLVDMNAFFIGCEMTRNPDLKGKPAAVAGDPKNRRGIILAANYEARKYKIKTAMPVHEAKRLYPDLICVPPDHRFYEEKSKEVMRLLSRFTPIIEQNSIDEAWMDMTGCEMLFGSPLDIARKIMKSIMDELDLWCSIGISENKFLAKMASEIKKPLGITELWIKEIPEKLWPMPVKDMYGIGKQTEMKLRNLAILTIGDLAKSRKELLGGIFGKYGEELHRLANGQDFSQVSTSVKHDNKSVSRSTTLSKDTSSLEYAKTVLLRLAEEVGMEARSQAMKGKTVSITIKYNDFQSITRQKSVSATYLTKDIYNIGAELLEENWNPLRPVRLLGIGLSGFNDNEIEQISLFDMLPAGENKQEKEEKLEKAMDRIKQRFGVDKIKRAKTIELE